MKQQNILHHLPANTVYDIVDSPVGRLLLLVSAQGLHAILWHKESPEETETKIPARYQRRPDDPLIVRTKRQLSEYFSGKRKTFDLPLAPGGTPFQQLAWQALRRIPYGQTISYGEQAANLGDKNKARAVGMANGANPISIVVPCHRVIGSNGKLTGFGGGIDNKRRLLALEKKYARD